MSEQAGTPSGRQTPDVPFGQIVFDNLFLWLGVSVGLTLISYIVWGLMDIGGTPTEPMAVPAPAASPAAAAPNARVVQVTLGDFWIRSEVTTFEPGVPYRFVVTNDGVGWHEFMVGQPMAGTGMTMEEMDQMSLGVIGSVAPGATMTLDVTFDRPYPSGTLELACRVAGHYEAGMWLPVVVGGSPAMGSATPTMSGMPGMGSPSS